MPHESACLRGCAEAHGVSERCVRNWRRDNDERWTTWKEDWVTRRGLRERPAAERHGPESLDAEDAPPAAVVDDGLGEGIASEILRARAECRRLSQRAAWLERQGRFEDAALVHRVLDSKRDGLRKLEADNPGILRESGELVHRSVLLHYCAQLRTRLMWLPQRLLAWVPEGVRDEVRPKLDEEVAVVLRAAQELDVVMPTAA